VFNTPVKQGMFNMSGTFEETKEILVPPGMLSFRELQTFKPEEREQYIRSVILDSLKNTKRGVTISELSKATHYNRITVARHLEHLVSVREAYRRQRNGITVFFKNGRLLNESDKLEIQIGDKIYSYYKLDNDEGSFIYIQEKTETPMRNQTTQGGIMIDIRDFHDFMKGLTQFGVAAGADQGGKP